MGVIYLNMVGFVSEKESKTKTKMRAKKSERLTSVKRDCSVCRESAGSFSIPSRMTTFPSMAAEISGEFFQKVSPVLRSVLLEESKSLAVMSL